MNSLLYPQFRARIQALVQAGNPPPKLTVLSVGQRADSQVYIKKKRELCETLGILFDHHAVFQGENFHSVPSVPELAGLVQTCYDGETLIKTLNMDTRVHGILLQLPVPPQFRDLILSVSPIKDVDGLHPLNLGLLGQKDREPYFLSCTTRGILTILGHYYGDSQLQNIENSSAPRRLAYSLFDAYSNQLQKFFLGKNVVVLGRSDVVGMPTFLSLLRLHSNVQVCHSWSTNTRELLQTADVVIVAIGKQGWVQPSWLKPNAVVIDVGIHRKNLSGDSLEQSVLASSLKDKLVGDVFLGDPLKNEKDPFAAVNHLDGLTPVPGGVGPLTVAMLIDNVITSAERAAFCIK